MPAHRVRFRRLPSTGAYVILELGGTPPCWHVDVFTNLEALQIYGGFIM